jgi:hypothetical protein
MDLFGMNTVIIFVVNFVKKNWIFVGSKDDKPVL